MTYSKKNLVIMQVRLHIQQIFRPYCRLFPTAPINRLNFDEVSYYLLCNVENRNS